MLPKNEGHLFLLKKDETLNVLEKNFGNSESVPLELEKSIHGIAWIDAVYENVFGVEQDLHY